MVGPGTGVAPFRAFVQERRATAAKGRNWLFFGDRQFTHDFLYQLEWQDALNDGALTRMDVAFSRDQPKKIYVQDRIWERRADLVLKHVRSHAGYEIMEIKWRPHDGGLYPVFRGTLSVEDVTGNYCHIDLDGSYVPPLGVAGAVFDTVLGHHIAVAVARELLDEIKVGFELGFQSSRVLHTAFSRRR